MLHVVKQFFWHNFIHWISSTSFDKDVFMQFQKSSDNKVLINYWIHLTSLGERYEAKFSQGCFTFPQWVKWITGTDTWPGHSVGCTSAWNKDGCGFDLRVRQHSFDGSWNHFYGHSLPTADLNRAVVSYWQKDVWFGLTSVLRPFGRFGRGQLP